MSKVRQFIPFSYISLKTTLIISKGFMMSFSSDFEIMSIRIFSVLGSQWTTFKISPIDVFNEIYIVKKENINILLPQI